MMSDGSQRDRERREKISASPGWMLPALQWTAGLHLLGIHGTGYHRNTAEDVNAQDGRQGLSAPEGRLVRGQA